jgi:hypothetical protein
MATVAFVNPRKRRKNPGGTAKQRAWRKKFGAMYGGRKSNPARKRKSAKRRRAPLMQSVKRHGKRVSRAAWRASGYRRNPRRRSVHRYRRNPSMRLSTGAITNNLIGAAQGATGSVLVDIAMGQIAPMLPDSLKTLNTYPIVKIGVALGLGAIGTKIAPSRYSGVVAEMAKGSMTVTLAQVIRGFMPSNLVLGRRRVPGVQGMGFNTSTQVLPDTGGRMGEFIGEHGADATTRRGYSRFGEFIGQR